MRRSAVVSLVAAYVGLSATRDVWLNAYLPSSSLSDSLLLSFAPVCVVAAGIWLIRRREFPLALTPRVWALLILLNVSTAATWVPFYASLELNHARTAETLAVALVPVFALAFGGQLRERVWACVLILNGCALTLWGEVAAPLHGNMRLALTGLLAGTGVGIFAALNIIFSKKLGELKWGPQAIFCARFWLLIVVAAAWFAGEHFTGRGAGSTATSVNLWALLPLVGLAGIVVPLFAFQLLIAASSRVASFAVPIVPLAVLFLELAVKRTLSALGTKGVLISLIGVLVASAGIYLGLRPKS